MSILTTTEQNVETVLRQERERCGPFDSKGRKVSRDCPVCGYGKLQFEGGKTWRCNGLKDPENPENELEACTYTHKDGTEEEKKHE